MKRESDLVKLVIDYLKLHRYFFWRHNVGAFGIGKRFVRFGFPGMADIFVVRKVAMVRGGITWRETEIIGIELKGDKGEQSQAQKNFQSEFENAGGKYILCRTLEEVIQGLK